MDGFNQKIMRLINPIIFFFSIHICYTHVCKINKNNNNHLGLNTKIKTIMQEYNDLNKVPTYCIKKYSAFVKKVTNIFPPFFSSTPVMNGPIQQK